MTLLTVAVLAQVLVLLGLALVVLSLARQVGILHERLSPAGMNRSQAGIEPGQTVPDLPLTSLAGTPVTITGTASALLFVSADCPICRSVLPAFVEAMDVGAYRGLCVADGLPAADGRIPDYEAYASERGLDPECFLVSRALGLALGVRQLPTLVRLDAEGRLIGRDTVSGPRELARLLAGGTAQLATPNGEKST
ncbi:MAG: hypothetical protein AB7I04_16140 [Pseudomonadales bacterium]